MFQHTLIAVFKEFVIESKLMLVYFFYILAVQFFGIGLTKLLIQLADRPRFYVYASGWQYISLASLIIVTAVHTYQVLFSQEPSYDFFYILLALSLITATTIIEIVYHSQSLGVYGNIVTGFCLLSLTSEPSAAFNHVQWLQFHAGIYLFSYSFCILALPLAIQFLWKRYVSRWVTGTISGRRNRQAAELDSILYHIVLLAVPILTLGIFWNIILLYEVGQRFDLTSILQENEQLTLALIIWCVCSLFIFTRVFLGWRRGYSVAVYLAGLGVVAWMARSWTG